MEYSFWSATILLFLIADPFGNIPIFTAALRNVPKERHTYIIVREVLIATMLLVMFLFGGQRFLQVMQLSELSLQFAGAVVLFLIALRMIFPVDTPIHEQSMAEPFLVPLAVPSLAGPSAMATVLLFSSRAPDKWMDWMGAIFVTMIGSGIILWTANRLSSRIHASAIIAMERLMGLILVAVSIEMLLRAFKVFYQSL